MVNIASIFGVYENGVKKIFEQDINKKYFVMGHVNANWFHPKGGGDERVKVEELSEDEIRINSRNCLPSRPKIFWNNEKIQHKDVSIKKRNKDGCCYSMEHIQNIDFVFYVEYKGGGPETAKEAGCNSSHDGDSISAVPDTSHDGGDNAAACYHLNVRTLEKGVLFKKESKHGGDYITEKGNAKFFNKSLKEAGKIGFRACIWNIDKDKNFVSQENWKEAIGKHLEIWIDEKLDNKWKKVHEVDDTIDEGFPDKDEENGYNRSTPPIIGSANEAIFKTNNLDIIMSKLIKAPIKFAKMHPLGTVL